MGDTCNKDAYMSSVSVQALDQLSVCLADAKDGSYDRHAAKVLANWTLADSPTKTAALIASVATTDDRCYALKLGSPLTTQIYNVKGANMKLSSGNNLDFNGVVGTVVGDVGVPASSPSATAATSVTTAPTATATATPTATPSPSPTASRSPSPSPSPAATAAPTEAPTPVPTPRPTPVPTQVPSPSPQPTPPPSPSPSPNASPSPQPTQAVTPGGSCAGQVQGLTCVTGHLVNAAGAPQGGVCVGLNTGASCAAVTDAQGNWRTLVVNGSPWSFIYFQGGTQRGSQSVSAGQLNGGTVTLPTFTLQ